jgi:putative N6-adenine-specific DNA methylase
MATFRSRQRANLRRDGKREPHSPHTEEGRQPAESPAREPRSRTSSQAKGPGETARGQGKPAVKPRSSPQTGSKPFASKPGGEERRRQPDAVAVPAAKKPFLQAKPVIAVAETKTAAPDIAPAQATAAEPPRTRRRLITPISEIPEERQTRAADAEPVAEPQVATAPAVQIDAPRPVAAPPATRRRLIKPVSDTDEAPVADRSTATVTATNSAPAPLPSAESPTPAPRRERKESSDRRKQYEPIQRRGLPANERMPTERPAFERRTAEVRRRGDAPVGLAMFAACPRGLEPVLQQELQRMAAEDIAPADGGVAFSGNQDLLMRVNLESRVASRVLLRLAHGPYRNEREINALAMQVDWPHHFALERTIKVKTDGVGAQVKSLEYVSLTVKDAICDRFRQATQERPSVDTRSPDVRVQVFLSPDTASIYLDSSGEALFKRGWRKETGGAPLRENLAAGILLLAGYNGSQSLIDPMCGSGTFLVEAAEIALNRAPGRAREFAFQKWNTYDAEAWEIIRQNARQAEKPAATLDIHGSDADGKMVAMAQANLARTGLDSLVTLDTKDLFAVRPPRASGLIVTNPPYGVRLDEQDNLAELYPLIGDWLKQNFAGWTANFFSGDLRLEKLIRLKTKRRIPLFNGALDCRLFVLPLITGSARDK